MHLIFWAVKNLLTVWAFVIGSFNIFEAPNKDYPIKVGTVGCVSDTGTTYWWDDYDKTGWKTVRLNIGFYSYFN